MLHQTVATPSPSIARSPAAVAGLPPDPARGAVALHRAAEPPRPWRSRLLPIFMMSVSILALCEVLVLWRTQDRIAVTDAALAAQRERLVELVNLRPDLPLVIQTRAPSAALTAEPAAASAAPAAAMGTARPRPVPPPARPNTSAGAGLKGDCKENRDPLCGIGFAAER